MNKGTDLKRRLKNGGVIFGPWCVIPSASVVNIIATTGVDFVIIDMEHGPHNYETAENMVRAAESEGCAALVRVSKNDEALILSALDIGAHGVIVPHISSKEEAELAISYSKYHPLGTRGFTSFSRAGKYSLHSLKDHAKNQNTNTLVVLLLEGREGIENLDDILSITDIKQKVDAIYIGAYDLSQALGYPGQVNHPEVMKTLRTSIARIRRKGIAAGGHVAKNKSDIKWMTKMGMQLITLMPDCGILYHAFENFYKGFVKPKKISSNNQNA